MVSNTLTKQCTKCGDVKVLTEFNLRKDGKYGRRSDCKMCKASSDKANFEKKRDYKLQQMREYHIRTRDVALARKRKWSKEVRAPQFAKLIARVNNIISKYHERHYPRLADAILQSPKLSQLTWYADINDFVSTHNTKGI